MSTAREAEIRITAFPIVSEPHGTGQRWHCPNCDFRFDEGRKIILWTNGPAPKQCPTCVPAVWWDDPEGYSSTEMHVVGICESYDQAKRIAERKQSQRELCSSPECQKWHDNYSVGCVKRLDG